MTRSSIVQLGISPNLNVRRPGKILLTRLGLDAHDRGLRIIARYLRDGGFEVLYTAPWQSAATVVNICLEEDIDAIGISTLAGDHMLILDLLRELTIKNLKMIPVLVGGIVPPSELQVLTDAGVARFFPPGSTHEAIVSAFAAAVAERRS